MSNFQEQFAQVDALARGDAVARARLEVTVDLAVRLIDGCDAASVALLVEGRSATLAVTDHVALEVDLVQYRCSEGPCLDAVAGDGQVVRVDLLDNLSEYRRMAPGAVDAGINSVLSVPFYDGSTVIGSLNLYSRGRDSFDAGADASARPFAEAAATAVVDGPLLSAATDLVAGIVLGMEDESVTNQAIGLIMHRKGCSADAARRLLQEQANASGASVVAAAQAFLDDPPPPTVGAT